MKSFLPSILKDAGIAPQTSLEVEEVKPRLDCNVCGMSFRKGPCPENGEKTTCEVCLDHFWHVEMDGVVVCGVTEN